MGAVFQALVQVPTSLREANEFAFVRQAKLLLVRFPYLVFAYLLLLTSELSELLIVVISSFPHRNHAKRINILSKAVNFRSIHFKFFFQCR